MKILIATGIYPPEIGGPPTYVHALVKDLLARGHEVSVVTYGDERTKKGEGWNVTVVSRAGGAIVRYARYALAVWKDAKNVDVVYLQGAVSEGFPGTIGAMLAGKKTVMRVPGDYAWEMYQQGSVDNVELLDEFVTHRHSGSTRILELLERWTSRRAKRVITPSRYLQRIVEAWGVSTDRIRVIVNSISPLPSAAPQEVQGRIVFTVVRAVPWKGVDFLIDILPRLSPDSVLVVGGDGPKLEEWKRLAESRGLLQRVKFLGRIDRATVASWYATAHVFVLATGYEGYPHVVAEAVSAGLPCIVSDRGGNPETKETFPEYVTVVPYRDADAWVEALSKEHPRLAPCPPRPFADVATETLEVLKDVCAS